MGGAEYRPFSSFAYKTDFIGVQRSCIKFMQYPSLLGKDIYISVADVVRGSYEDILAYRIPLDAVTVGNKL